MRMKWLVAFKRTTVILALYGIAIVEALYIPRYGYGVEGMLCALGATAFVAGYWIRNHWDT
jgi:hypothetical protein